MALSCIPAFVLESRLLSSGISLLWTCYSFCHLSLSPRGSIAVVSMPRERGKLKRGSSYARGASNRRRPPSPSLCSSVLQHPSMDSQQESGNPLGIPQEEERWGYTIIEEEIPVNQEESPGRTQEEKMVSREPNMENSGNAMQASNSQHNEQPPILLTDDQLQLLFDLRRDSIEIAFRQEQMIAKINDLQNQLFGSQPTSLFHHGHPQANVRMKMMLPRLEDFQAIFLFIYTSLVFIFSHFSLYQSIDNKMHGTSLVFGLTCAFLIAQTLMPQLVSSVGSSCIRFETLYSFNFSK
jgi:hypothetical protein